MVASNDVVLDFQGHQLRQSLRHYLDQRFFALVSLSTHLFIPGRGRRRSTR